MENDLSSAGRQVPGNSIIDLPVDNTFFVVVPAYNEAAVLTDVLDDVARVVPPKQMIVVDDGSTDETSQIATESGALIVKHLINRGQGAALATGIQAALQCGAEIIVTFDADGQHQADDIQTLVEPILTGQADVVLGTRFGKDAKAEQMPSLRRVLLRAGAVFTWLFSGIRISDPHNGLRALSGQAARQIRIRQDRMSHASEILEQIKFHRLRFVERPVHVRYTAYSIGKGQRNRDAFKIAMKLILRKVHD